VRRYRPLREPDPHPLLPKVLDSCRKRLIVQSYRLSRHRECQSIVMTNLRARQAAHYRVAVIPTRSRKPRDKAKIEVGVLIAERWILARLRHRGSACWSTASLPYGTPRITIRFATIEL